MIGKIADIYTKAFDKILRKYTESKANTVFVLVGITPYIHIEQYKEHVCEFSTFDKDGGLDLFSAGWFGGVFSKIVASSSYQILSHQQFASINEYLNEDFFKDRVVLVYDNVRNLYPLDEEQYIEEVDASGLEKRPSGLPVYQTEQMKIGEKYYYSLKAFSDDFPAEPLFTNKLELTQVSHGEDTVILDVNSDPYGVDVFVNQCIQEGSFQKTAFVKISTKNVLNKTTRLTLQRLNHLLSLSGGGIFLLEVEPVKTVYTPSQDAIGLLKTFWGESAEFRHIQVYENPELNNNIIQVSQGLLVDTIINEYKNSRENTPPRDIFITAPTGAGKSLIFQIPAFYVGSKGDITIVVSPLKALMTDQVDALINDRHYDRVAYINSDLSLMERERIIEGTKRGDIDILYLSPELLLSCDIRNFIGDRKLGLLIVDEAHLITTWGRDFRVDYWFLGLHINKIRKFNNYMFPLVALTATAVYGGTNDMVFESINSLSMHDPHMFVGNVRRENIEFVINTHEDYTAGGYDNNKEEETINFIRGIHELGMKGIVYAPYTKHICRLKQKCDDMDSSMTVAYHGSMPSDQQRFAYKSFKNNDCRIMIATKAFGMGVDIPDIQVVYHHAPSGLLPDYIQEIGRAARQKDLMGFAALTFSKSDLRYSKQLFGMSSLKTYQLKEVLSKIIRFYKSNGKRRNMLVATSDFGYIFGSDSEVDQKVSTALMMIEKDYLIKTRFNVLIARPRKLYTVVYARTNQIGLDRLQSAYGDCVQEITQVSGSYHTLKLNLDEVWSRHFSDRSFPQIKNDFYKQKLFYSEGIDLTPQIKVSITLNSSYTEVLSSLERMFTVLNAVFSRFRKRGSVFSAREFQDGLAELLPDKPYVEKLGAFILSTYSGALTEAHQLEGDSFLQQRHQGTNAEYRLFSTNYNAKFAQLIKILSYLFDGKDRNSAMRYLSINETPYRNHVRLGSLLEIMNMGTYETAGGDNPKIFIRLNDPRKIERDANSKKYTNSILDSVKERHKSSCALFEYFFTNWFSNGKRWDMIEDFFLGMSLQDLIEKYPSDIISHTDILKFLQENKSVVPDNNESTFNNAGSERARFLPIENEFYNRDRLLTIGHQTKAIKRWMIDDPVALHRTMEEYAITISKEDFKILCNKLRNNHFEYYRDYRRLKLLIEYPGYPGMIKAIIPYQEEPVKFYKWWRKNLGQVTMNLEERIVLFLAVDKLSPSTLIKAHRKIIEQ